MNAQLENTQEEYDNEYNKAFFGDEQDIAEEVAQADDAENTDAEVDSNDNPLEVEEDETQEEVPSEELDQPEAEADQEDEPLESDDAEKAETKKHKLKWNGEDIEVTDEELIALGQKGFDYTAKMQNISKYRKELEAAGIDDDVINIIKQVKQGDKAALAHLAKMNNIDLLDSIDAENDFNPLQNSTSDIVISEQVAPLMEQVMSNRELQAKMSQAEDLLPNAVIRRIAQDANAFHAVVSEITSGSFDQVMPRLNVRLSTMSDLDREYALNSPEYFGQLYAEMKNSLTQPRHQEVKEEVRTQPKAKPNMAEVGVKKSNSAERQQAVIKDAFTDDAEYQKILQRVKNQF